MSLQSQHQFLELIAVNLLKAKEDKMFLRIDSKKPKYHYLLQNSFRSFVSILGN